jgi:hypothetical protein
MTTISDLVKQRQDELEKGKERKLLELRAFLEKCVKLVRDGLGELYEELEQFTSPGGYSGQIPHAEHLPSTLEWKVEHPEYGLFYGIASVGIKVRDTEAGRIEPSLNAITFNTHSPVNGRSGEVNINDKTKLADFFLELAERKAEEDAKAKDKLIRELTSPFRAHAGQWSPETVETNIKRLVEIDPHNAAAHRQAYEEWLKQRAEGDKEVTASEEEKQKQVAAKKAREQAIYVYTDALRAWDEERDRIRVINLEKIAQLQEAYDQKTFPLWELAYALSGRDDEGGALLEVQTVFVLAGEPSERGLWLVWDHSKQQIVPMKFFNQVALTERAVVKPSDAHLCHLAVRPQVMSDHVIRTSPWWWSRKEEVQAEVDAAMCPIPPMPDAAAFGLSDADGRWVRRELFG